MMNRDIAEMLAVSLESESMDCSASWLRLARRAEELGCVAVAEEMLARAIELEAAEKQESQDAREYLSLNV